MQKKYKLGLLTIPIVLSTPIFLTACGSNSKKTSKHTTAEIIEKQNAWVQNIIKELDKESQLTPTIIGDILTKHKVVVSLSDGTSSTITDHGIGNKFNTLTNVFIPKYNDKSLTSIKKKELTLETFSQLFENKSNEEFHIASMVKIILQRGFELEFPTYATLKKDTVNTPDKNIPETPKPNTTTKQLINPIAIDSSKNVSWSDPSGLIYNDKYWNLPDLNYTEGVILGRGNAFYETLKIGNNGHYSQYKLEDWINIYDNDASKIESDSKHTYASTAPTNYNSKAKQFGSIYPTSNKDKNSQIKTGNNNNGLNSIYSGASFEFPSKKFNLATVETLDGKSFSTSVGSSNGWEHVSPQSMEEKAWGDRKTSKITKRAVGDLHNIRPSLQNLFNGPRSHSQYGIVPGDSTKSGVDFEIGNSSFGLNVVEPRVNVRGDIARIIFYMHDRYHVQYDTDYYKLMSLWATMDPVTKEEKSLDNKIAKVMGFHNDYITGVKQIPYSESVEKVLISAEEAKKQNPTNYNTHTWGTTPPKTFTKEIVTKNDAESLEWNKDKETLPFGSQPSKIEKIRNAIVDSQLILKVTMEDLSIHYFKAKLVQSKALIVTSFGSNPIEIKLAINDTGHPPAKLKTLLTGNSSTPYSKMTDIISSIEYKIVE